MQARWKRKVYNIKHTEGREGQLPDLTDLVDKKTVLVNDPLFSSNAVSQCTSKSDKHGQADRQ